MTLHITGMTWARPPSDLEASVGPASHADHIEPITRVQEEGGFERVLAGHWTDATVLSRAACGGRP